MNIAIIGRSELLYNTAQLLNKNGHEIKLVVTSKEAPEYNITSNDYKRLASELNCPFIYSPNVNEQLIIQALKGVRIDMAVSINYTGIISQKVINLFTYGILNAHGGDLPKYRGNACQAWAILNGESKIGLCIHKMVGGELDSGDIIERSYYGVHQNTRIGDLYDWMSIETPNLILDAVNRLSMDSNYILERQSVKTEDALRCYPRLPSDGKINWSDTAVNILRLINASSEPFQGAFTNLRSFKVIVWRAELAACVEQWCGVPGQVSKVDPKSGFIEVLTGEGKIRLLLVEKDGERTVPAEIIKSMRLRFSS
jgi:UDP-4-amino-4-deoxy-L-arabinose formyltransferase/UDP-glucuronic acid dehydrogenase (UDP-4-keto-hexauronic acid decarboxylating)